MSLTNPFTLITGASTGIGYELAKVFASEKHNLILVARTESKLQALKTELENKFAIKAHVLVADLSVTGAAEKLFNQVLSLGCEVENLVNNAGLGDLTVFSESDAKRTHEMIQVNIVSLTELTRFFLPSMIQKKSGGVLNVASVAGFFPGPFMTVYYATKAFVLSFSEGLAEEVSGQGVRITALCPGPTHSDFLTTAHVKPISAFEAARIPTGASVAEYGYRTFMRGDVVAIHGWPNRLMILVFGFLPRLIPRRLAKQFQFSRFEKKPHS